MDSGKKYFVTEKMPGGGWEKCWRKSLKIEQLQEIYRRIKEYRNG